jgi:hypothetical protein
MHTSSQRPLSCALVYTVNISVNIMCQTVVVHRAPSSLLHTCHDLHYMTHTMHYQNNESVLGFYVDSDNPNNGHPMSLSRSNRLELCRVRLACLLTDGRLALTEPQTLQCSGLTPQQLNS